MMVVVMVPAERCHETGSLLNGRKRVKLCAPRRRARMKAIRVHQFGDPSVMKLEEMPDQANGPGQVLVKIKAAGVNPVDSYIRAGQYGALPALPYIPGADAAGIVEAVGADVHD